MRLRRPIRREEKYALGTSLAVFACTVVAVALLKVGSYMDVPPPEITVRISPDVSSPVVVGTPPPLYAASPPARAAGRNGRTKPPAGIPIPVPTRSVDTLQTSASTTSSYDTSASEGNREPAFSSIDSLILRYPGFRSFALREQAQRRYPKSKRDSIIAWAHESFAAQMEKYGRIDPSTLNRMAMLQNSAYYGPYHITTPSVGIAIPFSYTDILQKIKEFFEPPPDE